MNVFLLKKYYKVQSKLLLILSHHTTLKRRCRDVVTTS